MKRGFRIRIYPTEEQEELLSFYQNAAINIRNAAQAASVFVAP